MFDTHCHVDVAPLDRPEAAERARAAGVDRVLAIGVQEEAWAPVAARRAAWPGLAVALGVHPQVLPELGDGPVDPARAQRLALASVARLEGAARALGAVAIGECGLDHGTLAAGVPLAIQASVLDAHVEVARALDLPLVLHVMGLHGAAHEALSRHGRLRRGGVVHAWSGSPELAERWVALGFAIAIGPSALLPQARRPVQTARRLPLHALVLETDAPFSHPPDAVEDDGRPRRVGWVSDLIRVAARVAEVRGITLDALAKATTENAERLFG